MVDTLEIWEHPKAEVIYMVAGWRQWADAGSVSSGLPRYLIRRTKARQIGLIQPEDYYLFQFPGTHDLVRPVIQFEDGYPKSLQVQRNEIYYSGNDHLGLVVFLGDEPHMQIERYVEAFLGAAQELKVRRIVVLGGVYGELPYDKERMISSTYSLPVLKDEVQGLSVNLSDYKGGASIGSYICRRAGERGLELVSFYAFVPTYEFSGLAEMGNTIRIENDFTAWLGIMQRINFMLKMGFNLKDLEKRSQRLIELMNTKVEELENNSPQLGVREYLYRLSENFEEVAFTPLEDVWEDELRRLLDKFDAGDETPAE